MPNISHEILLKNEPDPEFTLYSCDLGIWSLAISDSGIQELKAEISQRLRSHNF